ncbi:MAG: hypothetical protein IT435_05535 [Phycisphaerales bacterium]|nr:hypothetical protein [Phycisphaerales bacterium]
MLGITLPRARFRELLVFLFAAAIACLCGPAGCTEIGGEYRQNAEYTKANPRSPNRIGLAQADDGGGRKWNYNLESAAAAAYTEFNPDGSMTRAAQGTPTRDLFVQLPNGMKMTWSSGADLQLKGFHLEQQGANQFTASADEFSTLTSSPQKAMNQSLEALVPAWNALTDAEREARLRELEVSAELGDTIAPLLLTFLRSLGGGL